MNFQAGDVAEHDGCLVVVEKVGEVKVRVLWWEDEDCPFRAWVLPWELILVQEATTHGAD